MQKVKEHYRKQGQTRNSNNQKRATMHQSFFSEGNSNYQDSFGHDRVDHLYDTLDDEMRSVKVQQMVRQRVSGPSYPTQMSQNYNVPIIQGMPYNMPIQNPTAGTYMAQAMPQFQQMAHTAETVTNVPNVPAGGNLDLNGLIQLLNTVSGGNRSGLQIQDQMVATRSGARSDPAAKTDF